MSITRSGTLTLTCAALLCVLTSSAHAELADIFKKQLAGLELEPVGKVLANTLATTYPVASASSSVTYVYNPALESFERQTGVLGPIFGERAETVGERQFSISLSYSYVHPDDFNGRSLKHLVNKAEINGSVVSYEVEGGVILADGRFTNFLPIRVDADLDVDAHLLTPSVTYGVTPELDVNMTLPLVRTSLDATTHVDVPDPRLPQFALSPGDPNASSGPGPHGSDEAFGVGDLLLRAKYVALRQNPVDLALGLGVSFPTGNEDNFQGTGTYRVQPSLFASRTFVERIQPLLNLGVDINCDDVDASAFRWAVGATGQIITPLSAAIVFLGRNEFGKQTDSIDNPFFLQIERNDIYDFSIGLRWMAIESAVLSVNFIVPMNDDGFRADFIPTLSAEYTF